MNNAHGVRLSLLHSIHNGIVMPTWPGCLYNQIEVLSTGASGRVGSCDRHCSNLSFLYHGDILFLSKESYLGSVVSIHGYKEKDHYPALSFSKVKSHACESKASTTSA